MGFALGGGQALNIHLGRDRMSKDLDYYQHRFAAEPYAAAESALREILERHGYSVNTVESLDTFRALDVEKGDERARIDLGYDARSHPPSLVVQGIGPILCERDVVYGKVRALIDRETERDFVDVHAILRDGRWGYADVLRFAAEYDATVTTSVFRRILSNARLGDPVEYAYAGVPADKLSNMFRDLSDAGRCSVCHRPLTSLKSVERGMGLACAKRVGKA